MRIPKVKKRRYYDLQAFGKTYMESHSDFIANNIDACLWFLENRDKINDKVKSLTAEDKKWKAFQ